MALPRKKRLGLNRENVSKSRKKRSTLSTNSKRKTVPKIRKKLFLIDNSSTKTLINLWNHEEIEYIFVGKNIGFGKAHNLILHKVDSKYHLILNPDVFCEISHFCKDVQLSKYLF